jgi:hypothetical protein
MLPDRFETARLILRPIEPGDASDLFTGYAHRSYTDKALTPVPCDGREELQLYTQTAAAKAAVTRERRVAGL